LFLVHGWRIVLVQVSTRVVTDTVESAKGPARKRFAGEDRRATRPVDDEVA
jgi:hypothetical protein